MSRCPLWQQAAARSGVTPERAAELDEVRAQPHACCIAECRSALDAHASRAAQVNLYEQLGEAALRRLSTAFYERVYSDRVPLPDGTLLRHAFANTTKADAASNQSDFLIERLGGPPLYTQRKGPFALIGRHAPYAGVTRDAAHRWLQHMDAALAAVPEVDEDARRRLQSYFRYTAYFIVEGRALVNPARLIGYGGSKHSGGA